ncbi:RDD family protein [Acholeplasma granularum]|uniref:RDD family protein n=1 Tax=Acholeplasma granularum TaxID=264635 RepID=UPI0004B2C671|nr:RDD family protein [Acholeplasma granularum]
MENDNQLYDIDGNPIDFSKDDLVYKLSFETANLVRRLSAYIIDLLLIVVIWYLVTLSLFNELDKFVQNLGVDSTDFENLILLDTFKNMVLELFFKAIIYWIGIKIAYFTLVPAIIGNGQTIGKLLVGIGVVRLNDLEEVSPTRLIIREVVGRAFIETLLIIPYIVSTCMMFISKDSRSLHDRVSKTIVIKLDLYNLE